MPRSSSFTLNMCYRTSFASIKNASSKSYFEIYSLWTLRRLNFAKMYYPKVLRFDTAPWINMVLSSISYSIRFVWFGPNEMNVTSDKNYVAPKYAFIAIAIVSNLKTKRMVRNLLSISFVEYPEIFIRRN